MKGVLVAQKPCPRGIQWVHFFSERFRAWRLVLKEAQGGTSCPENKDKGSYRWTVHQWLVHLWSDSIKSMKMPLGLVRNVDLLENGSAQRHIQKGQVVIFCDRTDAKTTKTFRCYLFPVGHFPSVLQGCLNGCKFQNFSRRVCRIFWNLSNNRSNFREV